MTIEAFSNKQIKRENPERTKRFGEIRGVNRAVYTLFVTPEHDTLHSDVAQRMQHEPQRIQPSLPQTIQNISSVIEKTADPSKKETLDRKELTALSGVLIQFTDYVPQLQSYAQTPYSHVARLYDDITEEASGRGRPLPFANQLEIALHHTEGDIPQALWRLFMTSRLHARWLDGDAITELPDYPREEKVEKMVRWQQSIAACKPFTTASSQDGSGDTYYAWTHALAAVVYDQLPQSPNARTRSEKKIFERGTGIMHTLVHSVNPQTVVNDHSRAAAYGNAIGKVCAEALAR